LYFNDFEIIDLNSNLLNLILLCNRSMITMRIYTPTKVFQDKLNGVEVTFLHIWMAIFFIWEKCCCLSLFVLQTFVLFDFVLCNNLCSNSVEEYYCHHQGCWNYFGIFYVVRISQKLNHYVIGCVVVSSYKFFFISTGSFTRLSRCLQSW